MSQGWDLFGELQVGNSKVLKLFPGACINTIFTIKDSGYQWCKGKKDTFLANVVVLKRNLYICMYMYKSVA